MKTGSIICLVSNSLYLNLNIYLVL